MENNGKVCGICDKWFSSGKAIGGHMRSHYVKLPIPPKLETNNQVQDDSANSTQHPIQSAPSLSCYPKEKHTENSGSMKRNLSAISASSTRENKSESYPQTPTHKRSKSLQEQDAAADTKSLSEQTSPISETKIPRGAWIVWDFYEFAQQKEEAKAQKIKEINEMKAEDSGSRRGELLAEADSQTRFKCERCGKVLRSFQALGGHKAHCRNDKDGDFIDQKPFQCPYCNRFFKSAQALGGHRRVHFSVANEF
ncbi:unnamed protein product [Vicia faba]|uniref:C2H2-type domain-containing protein n=1 Tax=Vicia faba TaxID=3906 RepID=A0AAV0ZVC5_VICFA|nr:unnamed protein product [Vicia faba]